jgi:hypothetical protein
MFKIAWKLRKGVRYLRDFRVVLKNRLSRHFQGIIGIGNRLDRHSKSNMGIYDRGVDCKKSTKTTTTAAKRQNRHQEKAKCNIAKYAPKLQRWQQKGKIDIENGRNRHRK